MTARRLTGLVTVGPSCRVHFHSRTAIRAFPLGSGAVPVPGRGTQGTAQARPVSPPVASSRGAGQRVSIRCRGGGEGCDDPVLGSLDAHPNSPPRIRLVQAVWPRQADSRRRAAKNMPVGGPLSAAPGRIRCLSQGPSLIRLTYYPPGVSDELVSVVQTGLLQARLSSRSWREPSVVSAAGPLKDPGRNVGRGHGLRHGPTGLRPAGRRGQLQATDQRWGFAFR